MLGSTMRFLIYGLIWLFIFSLPVRGGSQKLFDLGHGYIVDSEPVKRITLYLSSLFNKPSTTSLEDFQK